MNLKKYFQKNACKNFCPLSYPALVNACFDLFRSMNFDVMFTESVKFKILRVCKHPTRQNLSLTVAPCFDHLRTLLELTKLHFFYNNFNYELLERNRP